MVYDRYGRLQFDPDIHDNHGKRWSQEDTQYLVDYYYSDGPDAVSFALGRTIQTVMQKATDLRKQGRLNAPAVRTWHKRTRSA